MQKSSVVFQICDDILLEPQNLGKTKTNKEDNPPKTKQKSSCEKSWMLGNRDGIPVFFQIMCVLNSTRLF